MFKQDELVLLLGAGASVEAGIPSSQGMIDRVEQLLEAEWSEHKSLYHYIKSSIRYGDGIRGTVGDYNIERLVGALDELRRGDEHPLYPFIGAWNTKLAEVGGRDLINITCFRSAIVRRLRDEWATLKYDDDASYFSGLVQFHTEYQYPLRVFTLNYDLCVEKNCSETTITRGFDQDKRWDWRLFGETGGDPPGIYLYKLHGSIDWKYERERLIYVGSFSQIDPDDMAIIFGTAYKLQYVDPFLFFAYEFRKWTLEESKLIITVGYAFGDPHINGIIRQALRADKTRRVLSVRPIRDTTSDKARERIRIALDLDNGGQIECWDLTASSFFRDKLVLEELSSIVPKPEEPFEEVK